jgi:hypothetical protein
MIQIQLRLIVKQAPNTFLKDISRLSITQKRLIHVIPRSFCNATSR